MTGRKSTIRYSLYVLTVVGCAAAGKSLVLKVECVGEAGLQPGFSVFSLAIPLVIRFSLGFQEIGYSTLLNEDVVYRRWEICGNGGHKNFSLVAYFPR